MYFLLKIITQLALKVYFKKIHIEGEELLPKEGPYLIVANHPSSFLDPISVAVLVKQKISFLAKGGLFKNKLVAAILRKLNMVAIYRAQDNPEMLSSNNEVFKDCYKKLAEKEVIMIFPEGISEMERSLRKIKTGAARIALGAEKENNYNLNVKIVPIGLNYTKSSRFRSELIMIIGKPITAQDYQLLHQEDEISTIKKLTQEIENSIRDLIITIDRQEHTELIERIESIYKARLLETTNIDENKNIATIKVSQGIIDAIKHFQEIEPQTFDRIKFKIDNYFDMLEQANLTDRSLQRDIPKENLFIYLLKVAVKLIPGFPLWLFGIINSYLPYRLPRFFALLISDSEAFYGALLMSLGTFFFVLFYSIEIVLVGSISHSYLVTLLYAIALPVSGLFTIYYARFARKFYYNWKLVSNFYSKQQLISELIDERKRIIIDLEQIRAKFNTRND